MKFQQYTGPVQAKGLEDTAFYRYNVLLSLNEVGGDPVALRPHGRRVPRGERAAAPELAVRDDRDRDARHQARRRRARAHQRALGDARRLGARSRPSGCGSTAAHATIVDGEPAPDRNDEYRFYQALLGDVAAWRSRAAPTHRISSNGCSAYMIKAVKEAKLHTSWIDAERGVRSRRSRRSSSACSPAPGAASSCAASCRSSAASRACGLVNSLAQVVLKIGSPGVPDFYQGTELWDFSLVDPDNRRPVDFERGGDARRGRCRPGAAGASARGAWPRSSEAWQDGAHQAAGHRRRPAAARGSTELFLAGEYLPLVDQVAVAERHRRLRPAARTRPGDGAIAIAPRLVCRI